MVPPSLSAKQSKFIAADKRKLNHQLYAIYNEDVSAIDFMSREVIEDHLPAKALALGRKWLSIHKNALQEMWNTQEFKKLPPLE